VLYPFELVGGDVISSWDFKGVYSGNAELGKKAQADIVRLNGMFGTEGNPDYILYVSIAGQYDLLGDGAKEYKYLLRALAEDSKTTGLAWYNLGVLLTRFGALESARVAYEHAMQAQPDAQYVTAYLEFMTRHFAGNTEDIEKAFGDVKTQFGEQATLSEIRARWLEGRGRAKEAIAQWRKVIELSPQSASAVNVEIRRLEGAL
jgi:tetratricopeptide (TPR) repeat protein